MITNKMKKQPDHNRFKDSALQDGVFRYPPYQGASGVYPVSVDKESRGWIAVCLLLCLAIVTAGVCGGLVLRYTCLLYTSISMWTSRIGCSYLFALTFGLGVYGVWIAMFADWVVRAALFLWRLYSGRWKKKQYI